MENHAKEGLVAVPSDEGKRAAGFVVLKSQDGEVIEAYPYLDDERNKGDKVNFRFKSLKVGEGPRSKSIQQAEITNVVDSAAGTMDDAHPGKDHWHKVVASSNENNYGYIVTQVNDHGQPGEITDVLVYYDSPDSLAPGNYVVYDTSVPISLDEEETEEGDTHSHEGDGHEHDTHEHDHEGDAHGPQDGVVNVSLALNVRKSPGPHSHH